MTVCPSNLWLGITLMRFFPLILQWGIGLMTSSPFDSLMRYYSYDILPFQYHDEILFSWHSSYNKLTNEQRAIILSARQTGTVDSVFVQNHRRKTPGKCLTQQQEWQIIVSPYAALMLSGLLPHQCKGLESTPSPRLLLYYGWSQDVALINGSRGWDFFTFWHNWRSGCPWTNTLQSCGFLFPFSLWKKYPCCIFTSNIPLEISGLQTRCADLVYTAQTTILMKIATHHTKWNAGM